MTERQLPAWQAERIERSAEHAQPGTCARCGAPVIRARAGRVAALDVAADPTPLDPAAELSALLDGRLTWHLTDTGRVTWRDQFHISAGAARHLVLADHRCPTTKGLR